MSLRPILLSIIMSLAPISLMAEITPIRAELAFGGELGLEGLFRGLSLEAGLSYQWPALGAGCLMGMRWDRELKAFIASASAAIFFGPDVLFGFGAELPLNELVLEAEASATEIRLEPSAFPSFFFLEASLFELAARTKEGPRFLVSATLSWSAYRLVIPTGSTDEVELIAALRGLLGFQAGFRASLCLRSIWGGRLP